MKQFLILSLLVLTACGKGGTSKPVLLVIGDSISIGYIKPLSQMLADKYIAVRPTSDTGGLINCEGSTNARRNLEKWMKQNPSPEVIVWNSGIWDAQKLEYYPDITTLQQYEDNLIAIATRLKATKARVIFNTTTNLPLNYPSLVSGREKLENDIAWRVLPPLGVEMYDLIAVGTEDLKLPDGIHFTDHGSEVLAGAIASKVLAR